MFQNQVHIEVFPLIFDKTLFDFQKFYKGIINCPISDYEFEGLKAIEKLELFKINLTKRCLTHRRLCKAHLKVTGGINVAVSVFMPFKKCTKPQPIVVDKQNEGKLSSYTVFSSDKYDHIEKSKLKKYIGISSEMIEILPDEIAAMKNIASEGITLIGFKDKKEFKPYYNIEPALFITGDNEDISGSSQLLEAMTAMMKDKNKIGVGKIKLSERSIQRSIVLLPFSFEKESDKNIQSSGLYVIILPYDDEIRSLPPKNTPLRDHISKKIVKDLLDSFTIDEYNPAYFENPSLNKFFSTLQSLALGEDDNTLFSDLIGPNEGEIKKNIDVFFKFNDEFGIVEETDGQKLRKRRTKVQKSATSYISDNHNFADNQIIVDEIEEKLLTAAESLTLKDLIHYSKIKQIILKKNEDKNSLLKRLQDNLQVLINNRHYR